MEHTKAIIALVDRCIRLGGETYYALRDSIAAEIEKLLADLAAAQADAHDRIAELTEELAAMQAERDDANNECGYRIMERDEARAEAAALRVLLGSVVQQNIAFRWDGEKQCHVPWIMVEFAEVPSGEPSTAKGWRDRDAFAAAIDQARKEGL